MRWECPLGRSEGRFCVLFDGPCEPRSNGCLLANAPYLDADTIDERDAPLLTIQPVPWPQIARVHSQPRPASRRPRKKSPPPVAAGRRPSS